MFIFNATQNQYELDVTAEYSYNALNLPDSLVATSYPFNTALSYVKVYWHYTASQLDSVLYLSRKTAKNQSPFTFDLKEVYTDIPFRSSTVSLSENKSLKEISIYPNPANNLLYVESATEAGHMMIYNIKSGIELTQTLGQTEIQTIDISSLSPGIYFLKIGEKTKKFIKR